MPAELAIAASERSDVGRMVAQKSGFERPTTLALVHPDESHGGAVRGDVGAIYERPASVFCVVIDFGTLCAAPAHAVLGHGLLAGAWVDGHVIDGERATPSSSPHRFVGASAREEEGRRLARPKRIRTESSLEVCRRRRRSGCSARERRVGQSRRLPSRYGRSSRGGSAGGRWRRRRSSRRLTRGGLGRGINGDGVGDTVRADHLGEQEIHVGRIGGESARSPAVR
eukprot:2094367-Pleurochrysis_carterae.AAC.2